MKTVSENTHQGIDTLSLKNYYGQRITIKGAIHKIRKFGGLCFVILRDGKTLIQCKIESNESTLPSEKYVEGYYVSVTGICQMETRAFNGVEIEVEDIRILSRSVEEIPIAINYKNFEANIDNNLNFRPLSLRHPKQRAIFSIQSTISMLFRQGLSEIGFMEIHTPKLVFAGAEGGANVFKVSYFDKQLYLAQSPQFYKQMMVGVFGRVMEVGPVFRAEPHETSRHLNEYTSMDIEMGPIKNFEEIMEVETYILKYIFQKLPNYCFAEIQLLNIILPQIENIPVLTMSEALKILGKESKHIEEEDLDPAGEKKICQNIFEKTGSEFVFITHYPSVKRPVYAMEDPQKPGYTLSFDLLFRGLEITTGGQRIHEYGPQVKKMESFGYEPEEFSSYLQIHRYGMPPHGGFGLGLERLTMQLLRLSSIKEASLFPRTISRVLP